MPDAGPDLWTQLLKWVAQYIVPDWNAIVTGLIPLALLVVVLAGFASLARAWVRYYAAERAVSRSRRLPAAGADGRLSLLIRPLALVPVGAVVGAVGLLTAPGGEVANIPVLLAGLGVALAGVGAAIHRLERRDEPRPAAGGWLEDAIRDLRTSLRAVPRPIRRLPLILVGVGIAALAIVSALPIGAPDGGAVANVPLLVLGLAIGLSVAARSVRDWEQLDQG